jgi:hypothetical protein
MRLKNPQEAPPFGWSFVQVGILKEPITGYSKRDLAQKIVNLRLGNPAITAQYGLSTDVEKVELEVEEQNAARCVAHGWSALVVESTGPPTISFPRPQSLLGRAAAVGNAVKRPLIGVGAVKDWLGQGLKAVDSPLSTHRASVCVECPQNDPDLKGWLEKAEARIAEEVRSLLVVKDDLKAETPYDEKLGMCRVCSCVLKLKVHSPLDIVRKRTDSATMEAHRAVRTKSGQQCWVATET